MFSISTIILLAVFASATSRKLTGKFVDALYNLICLTNLVVEMHSNINISNFPQLKISHTII